MWRAFQPVEGLTIQTRMSSLTPRHEHLLNLLCFIETNSAQVLKLDESSLTLRIGKRWFEFWRPSSPVWLGKMPITITMEMDEQATTNCQQFFQVEIRPTAGLHHRLFERVRRSHFERAAGRLLWALKQQFSACEADSLQTTASL